MKAEYINPIIGSFAGVVQSFTQIEPKKGTLKRKEQLETQKEVSIILDVEGDVEGYFTFGFSKDTAVKIVEKMTAGMGGSGELDELGMSCLVEMAGITRAKISKELTELEYTCEVKEGKLVFLDAFPTDRKQITLEYLLETPIGEIELNIALFKKNLV